MSKILVGTERVPFSNQFPITPDSMGRLSPLFRELFGPIFENLENNDLAQFALVNWTCKEVVERTTAWGERNRFFRMLPWLFKCGTGESRPSQENFQNGIMKATAAAAFEALHILFPNNDFPLVTSQVVGNRLMNIFVALTSNQEQVVFLSKVDMLKQIRQNNPHCYRIDKQQKKLQKIQTAPPFGTIKEIDFNPGASLVDIQCLKENRLLIWIVGSEQSDQDNFDKNFCYLQAINQDTLNTDISHRFDPSPETPLPDGVTDIYLDDKFCIVIATNYCVIKMGKRTLPFAQQTLTPFIGMKIDRLSVVNKHNGQMEITLLGMQNQTDISLSYTMDPFDPLTRYS